MSQKTLLSHFTLHALINVFVVVLITHSYAYSKPWPYDPAFEPITPSEITRMVHNPNLREEDRDLMLSRADIYGLLESVVNECDKELKRNRLNLSIRNLYNYSLFIAHEPDYKPKNKAERLRQQNTLFRDAGAQAEMTVMQQGINDSFSWQTLAYLNFTGIGGDLPDALNHAKKALQLAPLDPYNHRLLANIYLQSGPTQDLAKALAHSQRASKLQPKARKPYRQQAQIYALQKNYKAAYIAFKKSWDMTPPSFRNARQLKLYESRAKSGGVKR